VSARQIGGKLHVASVLALGTVGIVAALAQDAVGAGLGFVGAIVAVFWGPLVLLGVGVAAALAGELGVVAGVALALTATALVRISALRSQARVDAGALSEVFGQLPLSLHQQLRQTAGSETVTTRHLVLHAMEMRPDAWAAALDEDPGAGAFDGQAIPDPRGGDCSQFAAEAVGVALALANSLGRPLDSDVLGVAACLVPLSASEEWRGRSSPPPVLQVGEDQAGEAVGAFADQPGGGHMPARMARWASLPPIARATLSREELAQLGPAGAFALQVRHAGTWAVALVEILAESVRDLALGILRMPGRGWALLRNLSRRSRGAGDAASPDTASAERMPTDAHRTPMRLIGPWEELPLQASLAWVVLRPGFALGAVAAALLVDRADVVSTAVVVLAATCGRGVRTPFLALGLAVAATAVAPVAGVLLVARVLIGEVVLFSLGRGRGATRRREGLHRVLAGRRSIVTRWSPECVSLDGARSNLETAVAAGDDEQAMDRAVETVAAAWAEARPVELVRAVVVAGSGILLGQWPQAGSPAGLDAEVRRLLFVEVGGGALARAIPVLAAGAVAAAAFPDVTGPFGEGARAGRATAAVAAFAVAIPLSKRGRGGQVAFAIVLAILALVLVGDDVTGPLAVGALAGLAATPARAAVDRLLVGGRKQSRSWPPAAGVSRGLRRHWDAAQDAIAAERNGLALEMLSALSTEPRAAGELANDCLGQIALLHLDAGRLHAATEVLEQMDSEHIGGGAALAAGMLQLAVGEEALAESSLARAADALDKRPGLKSRALVALAEARARLGDIKGATSVVASLRARPLALPGLAALVETEVALAAALARSGNTDRAIARLEELATWGFADDPAVLEHGAQTAHDLARASARANLLRGRLELSAEAPRQAAEFLAQAANRLSAPSDAALRATARTLLGVALAFDGQHGAGVREIQEGIQTIEFRRTQLRMAERRTAMIVADAELYRWALEALQRAGHAGINEAGLIAGALLESLRRSAISTTLQAGPLPLGPEAEGLADRLNALEMSPSEAVGDGSDATTLRAELARAVSVEFAAAYLPSAVGPHDLARAARRHGHVLAFHMPPDGLPAWRVWISPDGQAQVDQVGAPGTPGADLLQHLVSTGGFGSANTYEPWVEDPQRWDRLGQALLPDGLRSLLERPDEGEGPLPVLVVPDGALASVPWAALGVGGEPLLRRAIVQLVPTLDLVGTARPRQSTADARVLAHRYESHDTSAIEALSRRLVVDEAMSRDTFVSSLQSRRYAGVYALAHGDAMGLEQRLHFGAGAVLSAAAALRYPWPDWVVFAACLVGRVNPRAGQEPLGLAISCMLGGSSTVVASVVELMRADGAGVAVEVAEALAAGTAPAAALRDAQLRYLDHHPLASLADCLGLVSISTREMPQRRRVRPESATSRSTLGVFRRPPKSSL